VAARVLQFPAGTVVPPEALRALAAANPTTHIELPAAEGEQQPAAVGHETLLFFLQLLKKAEEAGTALLLPTGWGAIAGAVLDKGLDVVIKAVSGAAYEERWTVEKIERRADEVLMPSAPKDAA
jgi:hypothetical protein